MSTLRNHLQKSFEERITKAMLSKEGKDCQKTLMAIYLDKNTAVKGLSEGLLIILSSCFNYDKLGELRNLDDEAVVFVFKKNLFLEDDEFKTKLLNSLESCNFHPETMQICFHSDFGFESSDS